MRHLKRVSKTPAPAQTTGICDEITTTGQAKLCFTITFLQGFLLPFYELKQGGTGSGSEEG